MATFGEYKVHPVAAMFPLMKGDEFATLVADIKENGLVDPILLSSDGTTIIDGRNRWLACDHALVDPAFKCLGKHYGELDIIRLIVSKNEQRRHLDPGQRAIINVQIEAWVGKLKAEAKERQREGGKAGAAVAGRGRNRVRAKSPEAKAAPTAREQIARTAKVADSTVKQALKVNDVSPRLARDVRDGKISLNEAYKQARSAERANVAPKEKAAPSKTHIVLVTHLGEQISYPLPKAKTTFNRTNQQVSWAAWTWNPVTGCLHGCKYCYAREMAYRDSYKEAYPVQFTPLFHHERLDAPKNTDVPEEAKTDSRLGRVFVCSMADLYGKWVPDNWIEQVHAQCINNPQWEYLMLTKFPRRYVGLQLPPTAWLGTSVDEQKRVRLAEEAFSQIKDVRVKWLSLEPLLAPLEFSDLSMFDWIVIGAQSATEQPDGPVPAYAPPIEWVTRLTDLAHKCGCKVYQKPNLLGIPNPQSPGMRLIQEEPILPAAVKNQLELLPAAE